MSRESAVKPSDSLRLIFIFWFRRLLVKEVFRKRLTTELSDGRRQVQLSARGVPEVAWTLSGEAGRLFAPVI